MGNSIPREQGKRLIQKVVESADYAAKKYDDLSVERIELNILAANTTYEKTHYTGVNHKRILGIFMTTTDPAVMEGLTFSLKIDQDEIFPIWSDSRLLMSSTATPPNERFYDYVIRDINQAKIEISVNSVNFNSGFKVNFYLLCVNN